MTEKREEYKPRKFYYDCPTCGERHEVILSWPVKIMGRRWPKKRWKELKFKCMAELYIQHQKLHPIDIFPYHEVKIEKVV